MHSHTPGASTALVISDISIRQDAEGRYCLNDLHRAAGGEQRHRPKYWLKNQQTVELVNEIEKGGIPPIQLKQQLGTFVCKELVYAYAMWISPAFHLKVIRAYDALMTQPKPLDLDQTGPFQRINAAVLAGLQKMSRSLAKAYLVELGITPGYVAELVAVADRVPASPALPSPARYSNAAPFDHLAREVPVRADNEDEKYWYLNKATFEQICGDYDPGETALALRDRKLLRYDDKSLTVRPPRSLSGLQLKVYAVSKRLAQGGRDHG